MATRRRGLVGLGLRRGDDRDQLLQPGTGLVDALDETVEHAHPAFGLLERLLGGVGQLGHLTVEDLDLGGGRRGPGAGGLTHGLVEAEIEEGQEHVLALAGLGVEEGGELALGQHHARAEVLEGEPQELLDLER